jgi:hypothetical protein
MIESTLRLFNSVQVKDKTPKIYANPPLERMLKNGFILDPSIPLSDELLKRIEKAVGLSGKQMNASFHKSWKVVRDTPMETLVLQQIIHYFTTYGLERLGAYNQATVYIPKEVLQVPTISIQDLPVIVIHGLTKEEILEKIVELGSGVALMQETLDDIMEIIVANDYESTFVHGIKNRELKMLLYDLYNILPREPVEFLRYVVIKLTGESLLIKNDALIEKIKGADRKIWDGILLRDVPEDLASIFFRFKPIFLALKSLSKNKNFFNRLRKKANRMHRPLPEDYLNAVTAHLKWGDLDLDKLVRKLEGASIFRKVRLANALTYRWRFIDSIVYRVRNGRGWATSFEFPSNVLYNLERALEIICGSIVNDLRKNVEGKTIYIPEFMHYTIPATEKMFTGNFPTGTSVAISDDTVTGIHWTNTDRRIDLDLSVIGQSGKLGWDAGYRSNDLKILFSGDMTDAPKPHGATELFYFNGRISDPKIIMVNYFNFSDDEVRCDLLVAQEKVKSFDRNYMVDPNKVLARSQVNVSKKQNVIGLIANVDKVNRVYFANMSIGNSITSGMNDQSMRSRAYLVNSVTSSLELRDLLVHAGAIVVNKKPEGDFLDLSSEALNKTTILSLLQKKDPVPVE